MTESWLIWYLGGVDSESRFRFLKFRPQNPFSGKFGPKKTKFLFCPKIGTHCISRMLILFPTLVSWISNPKIPFWTNLGQKSQSCPFCLKIGTHGISRKLILFPALVFWISNPEFLCGQIWAKNIKIVCFVWKFQNLNPKFCCSYRRYPEDADLFHLKSVTGEDNKGGL